MKIVNKISELNKILTKQKNKKIGFVPTMGALHEGHLSLIRKAKQDCSFVVVSIFVNPTQFSENEDIGIYPRDIEKDAKLCEQEGVDVVFEPYVEELYNENGEYGSIEVEFDSFEKLSNKLCGKSRPRHFKGVCIVVKRLFDIVHPSFAYFGLKDYQQYVIIKKMVDELNLSVEIVGCDTVRDKAGLALSSRNGFLSKTEKKDALVLYETLKLGKKLIENKGMNLLEIKEELKQKITRNKNIKLDYLEIVDADSLEDVNDVNGSNKVAIMVAVYIGGTRLIDNLIV